MLLDVGRCDGKGSRSGQIDLKAEANSVLSFRVSDWTGGKVHSYPTNLEAAASVNWNNRGGETSSDLKNDLQFY